jgi:ribosome maturation factor RimP
LEEVGMVGALEEVRDLAEAVARRRSLTLWDVEMGGQPGRAVVRVLIDADGGVDLDTVAEVANEISRGLDLRDPIAGRYTLEVSSPGIERSLKRPDHFLASVGRKVVLKTTERIAGDSHRIEGTIVRAGDATVAIAASEDEIEVPYEAIRTARTVFEWN